MRDFVDKTCHMSFMKTKKLQTTNHKNAKCSVSKMLMSTADVINLINSMPLSVQQYNSFPKNTSPNLFLYKYNGREWYGIIKINKFISQVAIHYYQRWNML